MKRSPADLHWFTIATIAAHTSSKRHGVVVYDPSTVFTVLSPLGPPHFPAAASAFALASVAAVAAASADEKAKTYWRLAYPFEARLV